MATFKTHFVLTSLMHVNPSTGEVYTNKNVPIKVAVKGISSFNLEKRVIEDPDVPNSVGNPDIITYAELEAEDDFILKHVSDIIVTQKEIP